MNLKIVSYNYEPETGAMMACFVDSEGQPYAVFRGTGADEWRDDCVAGNQTDSEQQIKATEWINSLSEIDAIKDKKIVVSGHSKGGNKAMYTAVVCDNVSECYAFDGEGFSLEFCDKYKDKISEKKNDIHLTSSYKDYVNILLFNIAGDTKYVKNDVYVGNVAEYHTPNALFKYSEDGKLIYALADEGGQHPTLEMFHNFLEYFLENATESEKNIALNVIGEILTKRLSGGHINDGYILDVYEKEGLQIARRYFSSYLRDVLAKDPIKYELYKYAFSNFLETCMNDPTTDGVIFYIDHLMGSSIRGSTTLTGHIFDVLTYYDYTPLRLGEDAINLTLGGISLGRDFTKSTKEMMLSAAAQVEDEKFWQVDRWDCWYRIEKGFGHLNLEHYTANAAEYYRKMIDINGATRSQIESIFEAVYTIDSTFAGKINKVTEQLRNRVNSLKK